MDDERARAHVARVETLLAELESVEPGPARTAAHHAVQALVELYGEALARIMERIPDGSRAALAEDELVSHLLLIHDLHPVSLEARVAGALDETRPYLRSHGGDVELLGVDEEAVRLRLVGSCKGCPSSATTLRLAVEEAVRRAAPEVERIEAEGAVDAPAPVIPVASLRSPEAGSPAPPSWEVAGHVGELGPAPLGRELGGGRLVLLAVGRETYAYRDRCPACGGSLADGVLSGLELACAGCRRRYDVRRAGACVDDAALHLEPLPLLAGDDGVIRVAVGALAG